MAIKILNELRDRATYSVITANDVEEIAREEILEILPASPPLIEPLAGRPKVILVVGVNGTGKTTSTAKLARYFLNKRQTVLLAAADTFAPRPSSNSVSGRNGSELK